MLDVLPFFDVGSMMHRWSVVVLLLLVLVVLVVWLLVRQSRASARDLVTDEERRVVQAIRKAPVIVWDADRRGNTEVITLSMGGALTEYGERPGVLVGKTLDDIHPSGSPSLDTIRRVIDTQTPCVDIVAHVGPAGRLRHYVTSLTPTNDGHVTGVTSIAMDVTEIIEARDSALALAAEAALRAERERETRIATADRFRHVLDAKLRHDAE